MGWDYCSAWDSKAKAVAVCSKGASEYKVVGNELWVIKEWEGKPYIGLYLLSKSKNSGYGYKALSEAEYPYYYSCPLSFLEKVPPVRPEWREKVKEWHKEKAEAKALVKALKKFAAL